MRRTRSAAKEEEKSSASAAGEKVTVPNGDVLFQIFLRLPTRSVLSLKRVCRSWHSLATDPSFVREHTRRLCDNSAAAGPNSILIQFDPTTIHSPKLTLCILDRNLDCTRIRRRFIRLPVKSEYTIDGHREYGYTLSAKLSCDRLLCFISSMGPNPYYICNPITKTWTFVAESLHQRFKTSLIGFYFHRSTGEYRLLQYFIEGRPANGPVQVGYEVATVNGGENKSWRTVYERRYPSASAVNRAGKLDRLLAAGIYHLEIFPQFVLINENLHWLLLAKWLHKWKWNDYEILAFDTSSEKFRLIPTPFKFDPYSRLPPLQLHEIGGNLCICRRVGCPFIGKNKELWLLKDYNSQEWVKTHSIVFHNGITRRPLEGEEDLGGEDEGNLFKRWGPDGNLFTFYDLKRKNCCYTNIQKVFVLCPSMGYKETLVTV